MLIRKILVPLDGTDFAEAALGTARIIAERNRASLELVGVHAPEGVLLPHGGAPPVDPALDSETRRGLRTYLDRIGSSERGRGTTPVSTALLEGGVAEELAAEAERREVELVVMATHARGGLGRLWLGSTADQLIRRVHVPVLLVERPDGELESVDPAGFRRVVMALAGNDADERVLDAVFGVTDTRAATYTLLHVAVFTGLPPANLGVPRPPDELAGLPPGIEQVEMEQAQRYLERIAGPLHERGVAVDAQVDTGTSVADAIVQHAARASADLIALATRAPGALERAALGSVADKVMRRANTAVLVCPPRVGS
jgi:nucleotide-binding universal stress UspA family protein